jgi:hypothetical protein
MKKITFFILASLISVMFVSAAPTTGLKFINDKSSIMTIAPTAAFSPAQFTIEVWVNYHTLNGNGYILSTEGWNPKNHGFSLRLAGSNKNFNFSIGDGSGWPGIDSSTPIVTDTWYHLAVTCTATQMTLYVNGVQDATAAIVTPMVASTEIITLGDSPAWSGRNFDGQMSDLRFWNVVRTPAQITADMTSTLKGTETGLVADWKMNEGKGTTAADATGKYNLTIPTAITWFGTVSGINPVLNNSAEIETVVYGRTIEVSNNSKGNVKLAIYSVNGQKVLEDFVASGNKFQKQLTNPKGAYILTSVAKDGSTYAKKFIITE